jgi:hypothetical protein
MDTNRYAEKAADLLAKSVATYGEIAGLAQRAERAAEIVRTPIRTIFRQVNPQEQADQVVYFIPSSDRYEDDERNLHEQPPYYAVAISRRRSLDHHCTCADYRRTLQSETAHPAPQINGRVCCKHILAALALEQALQIELQREREAALKASRERTAAQRVEMSNYRLDIARAQRGEIKPGEIRTPSWMQRERAAEKAAVIAQL